MRELEAKVEGVMTKARERARREGDLERRLEQAVDMGVLRGERMMGGADGYGAQMNMGVKAVLEGGVAGRGVDEMDIDDVGGAGGAGGSNIRTSGRLRAKR